MNSSEKEHKNTEINVKFIKNQGYMVNARN